MTDGGGGITLSATGYKVQNRHMVDLEWIGATSTRVDIYRNGSIIVTTKNDGSYTNRIRRSDGGGSSYTYKVCEKGSTSICSNETTVNF